MSEELALEYRNQLLTPAQGILGDAVEYFPEVGVVETASVKITTAVTCSLASNV